jgi:hypothetical protein
MRTNEAVYDVAPAAVFHSASGYYTRIEQILKKLCNKMKFVIVFMFFFILTTGADVAVGLNIQGTA